MIRAKPGPTTETSTLRTPPEIEEKIACIRRNPQPDGTKIRRFQYTVIDDATRIRAIRTGNGHDFQAKFHWHVGESGNAPRLY